MIKTIAVLLAVCLVASTQAFVPQLPSTQTFGKVASKTTTRVNLFDEGERTSLTRDTEPEDFFST